MKPEQFDAHASSYDADLARGLSLTGEDKAYYARERIRWLRRRLREHGIQHVARVLDFGCGTGSAVPHILAELDPDEVIGVDTSRASLEVATRLHGSSRCQFIATENWRPEDTRSDLAVVNGVFHHIPPDHRAAALASIRAALLPGAPFAFFENNPWNPGTRIVMSRIPFDRDAQTISPPGARRLLTSAEFEVLSTDSLFYFPALLRSLRPLEPLLATLPFGGQYLILARRR